MNEVDGRRKRNPGGPIRVKQDAHMHHMVKIGETKKRKLRKKRKLNENRGI